MEREQPELDTVEHVVAGAEADAEVAIVVHRLRAPAHHEADVAAIERRLAGGGIQPAGVRVRVRDRAQQRDGDEPPGSVHARSMHRIGGRDLPQWVSRRYPQPGSTVHGFLDCNPVPSWSRAYLPVRAKIAQRDVPEDAIVSGFSVSFCVERGFFIG